MKGRAVSDRSAVTAHGRRPPTEPRGLVSQASVLGCFSGWEIPGQHSLRKSY